MIFIHESDSQVVEQFREIGGKKSHMIHQQQMCGIVCTLSNQMGVPQNYFCTITVSGLSLIDQQGRFRNLPFQIPKLCVPSGKRKIRPHRQIIIKKKKSSI
jgi:hypothetical protein